jgi:hypothetical protein
MALTGHSNLNVHQQYTQNPNKMAKFPGGAAPDLTIEESDEDDD